VTRPRDRSTITLALPPLDIATVAWLLDLSGRIQELLWRTRGAELEAYWTTTEPGQPITGPLTRPRQRTR
jgi:hypothetical protein